MCSGKMRRAWRGDHVEVNAIINHDFISWQKYLTLSRLIVPTWLPAYHRPGSGKVVNSTGAGNAFLGAFAIGYQDTGSYIEAAKYGAVGASLVVEQVGTPILAGQGPHELWNGASVRGRLEEYSVRCVTSE